MKKNYMVDVDFEIEGTWENFADIPLDELIKAAQKRLDTIKAEGADGDDSEAFGFCGVYKV